MADLFPFLSPQTIPVMEPLPLCREVAWNFKEGYPIFEGGEPVIVEGKDAVQVWVWKALITVRKRFVIYSWNFGNEVESLIGQNYVEELKKAEAIRYVREAILGNPYVTGITDMEVTFHLGDLAIHATVHTIYGEVNVIV